MRGRLVAVVIATMLLRFVAPAPAVVDEGWSFVRDDEGVVVHRRAGGGSGLDEVRARGVVEAPLAAVLAVIQDSDRGAEWMVRCAESAVIEQVDRDTKIVYSRTSVPWPFADRDAVVRGRLTFEPGLVRLAFESIEHPSRPPVGGVVRMPSLRGQWMLRPERNGRSAMVEYQILADPGGMLLPAMVNFFSGSLPWDTIRNLRRQMGRHRYVSFEQELRARPEYRALVGVP